MEPVQQIKPQEHEIDLIEIITILWKARKFISIVTAVFLLIGVLYIFFATKMYSGTITLYPAQSGAKNPMVQMAAQMGMAGATAGDANYNIPDVVKSRTLSEQIVAHEWEIEGFDKNIDLVEYFNSKFGEIDDENIEVRNKPNFFKYSEMVSSDRINVDANLKTGLITVSVFMENPRLAADIANFISVFVANWVNDTQKASIKKNLDFINERASVLGYELQEAENELKKFRETNRNILNSPDLQLELQRLQRQVTIKQEVYLTMIKQREINQIDENKSVDVIRILDKAIIKNKTAKPNKKIIVGFSMLFGLMFASIFLTFLELYKNKRNGQNH